MPPLEGTVICDPEVAAHSFRTAPRATAIHLTYSLAYARKSQQEISRLAKKTQRCFSSLPGPPAPGRLHGGDRVPVRLPGATASTCRLAAKRLTLTGGADRVGVRVPDRGYAYKRRQGHRPLPPVNAARANGGTRGRQGADRCVGTGRHLPDRSRAADAHRRDHAHVATPGRWPQCP